MRLVWLLQDCSPGEDHWAKMAPPARAPNRPGACAIWIVAGAARASSDRAKPDIREGLENRLLNFAAAKTLRRLRKAPI
jgi:hypothetical protein